MAVRHRVTPTDSNVYLVFKLERIGGALGASLDPEEIAQAGFYTEAEMEKMESLAEFSRQLCKIELRLEVAGLLPFDIPSMAGPGWTFYAPGGRMID